MDTYTELVPRPDEITLHLIARGLIDVLDAIESSGSLPIPYPSSLQRGWNRLTLAFIQRGKEPPHSIFDVFTQCRTPIAQWGLDLPDGIVDADERFLEGSFPTSTCEDWARYGGDIESDLREERLLAHVVNTCRAHGAQDAYVAFRRLLIDRPVMDGATFQTVLSSPALLLLSEHVRAAYVHAPRTAARDGFFETCGACGGLLGYDMKNRRVCSQDRCRMATSSAIRGQAFAVHDGVVCLRRELHRFIAMPGRAELRIAQHLEQKGVNVEYWPSFDRYDLRVVFPDGSIWAIDVKDWRNPYMLARHINATSAFPTDPPWDRAFFVIPDDRRLSGRDYIRVVKMHCHTLSDQVDALFERDFMRLVKKTVEMQRGKG